MNRIEIREKLKALPYGMENYWLITGAAMVWYGIKDETGDVDLGCNKDTADCLEADGCPFTRTADGRRWFKLSEDVEVFEDWMKEEAVESDGVSVVSISGLLAMKRKLGREKDKQDIELILRYLRSCACIV